MQRITITIDDDLMEALDEMIKRRNYQNRSEALRDLARSGLQQAALKEGDVIEQCVGVLSYTYNHSAREICKKLTESHHAHHDISVASMHVHLNHDRCLEISILKGKTADICHFADHIKAERHITHGNLTILPD